MNSFVKRKTAVIACIICSLVALYALSATAFAAEGDSVTLAAADAQLSAQESAQLSAQEHRLDGSVLDGATVRFRPKGSYSALSINQDGTGYHNVVHMFHIGGSSRFYLKKADDSSYYIFFYNSFTAKNPRNGANSILDVEHHDREGSVIHVVGKGTENNKRWKLIQQADGSYHIQNMHSGQYWSLRDRDINANNNKLCQKIAPMAWEMEVISGNDAMKAFDSYNFKHNNTTVTSSNWMSSLPDTAFLSDLSIPGVHDAGTCHIGVRGEAGNYRCQQFYIDDLLRIGVRYFDMRLLEWNGTLALSHGSGVIGRKCQDRDGDTITIETAMNWMTSFLREHPKETIILQLKDESGTDASKRIYNYFKGLATQKNSIIYCGDGTPELKDVRGKIVLISRISESHAGGSYRMDPFDPSKGSWAIYADWKEGKDDSTDLAASTDKYEVWTQDNYSLKSSNKWKWIKGALFGEGGKIGAYTRHKSVEAGGKKAWVVNYTSCTKIPSQIPQKAARDINKWLKQSNEISTLANQYMGIVCFDFVDEQLAQRIYAINYRYDVDEHQDQYVTFDFGGDTVVKTYGDAPFTNQATTTGDGAITYTSSDPEIASVDATTGEVSIHRAGTALITATAAETATYREASDSYALDIAGDPITVRADDKESPYSAPLEKLTFKIEEGTLAEGDTIESLGIDAYTLASPDMNVGEYPIYLTAIPEENYEVTLIAGSYMIRKATPTATAPTANELTYTGNPQKLVSAGSTTGGVMQYCLGSATEPSWAWSSDVPEGTDAGAYHVWYRVFGGENYKDVAPACVEATIAAKNLDVAAPRARSLTYTGSAQRLVTPAKVSRGTAQYALGADDTTEPTEGWSSDVPEGTDAGTYHVWYKIDADGSYGGIDAACVDATIDKATPTVTAPTANKLAYDGSAQQLVAVGSTTGGTLQYALGTDGTTPPTEGWSSDVPEGTDAGNYYVWYKVASDTNYEDVDANRVVVTISPTTPDLIAPVARKLTYTGKAQALVTAGSVKGDEMQYALGSAAAQPWDDPTPPWVGWSTSVPTGTDAGTYYVWYKYDINHTGVRAAYVTVTIGQATPTITSPTANALDYNGEEQQLVTAGSAKGGEMLYALGADLSTADANGWSTSVPTGTDAGTYNVWYTVDSDKNHEAVYDKCITVKIEKAAQEVMAPVGKKDLVYNGKEQDLASAASVSYGPVQYALGADDAKPPEDGWGASVPTGADAGAYHVWYKVEGTDNYSGVGPASVLPTSVIAKATPTVTAPTAKELTCNGDYQALVSAGSTTGGKMQYALGADPYTPPENGWGASVPTRAGAGTYYVWYRVVGDANYEDVDPTCVWPTSVLVKAVPTVTAPTANKLTYNGNPQPLASYGWTTGGEMQYALGTDDAAAPASGWDRHIPTRTDAGTYHVWYKVIGDDNYYDVDPTPAPSTSVIAKAVPTVTAPTANALIYNGSPQALVSAGSATVGTLQYALGTDDAAAPAEGWSSDVPKGTDAGTYHVWYKVAGGANYEDVAAKCVEATISTAPPGVTVPVARSLTYTGEAQQLVTAGTSTSAPMQYALGADSSTAPEDDWGTSVPTGADAGTYHVWYRVVGDADHGGVGPACVEATIAKASPTVTAPTAKKLAYNGSPQALVSPGSATGGEMRYALGDDAGTAPAEGWSSDVPEGTDAGAYHVWYRVDADGNYDGIDAACVEATIDPASTKVTAPKARALTYTGNAQRLVTPAKASQGTVLYALGTDNATAPADGWDEVVPTGANAGAYHVWYRVDGDANHVGAVPACVEAAIAKAVPTVTAPTANALAYDGSAQALVVAGSSTGGTLQYALGDDAGTAPTEGWSADVPTGTDGGAYHVWYKVVGDENYDDVEAECVEATIDAAAQDVTKPQARTLAYTGKAQALVTAGSAKGGEMQYALGDDAGTAPTEGWSSAVPEGTGAGAYHVWYKVDATNDYQGVGPECVEASIAKATPTVTAPTANDHDYNGKAQALVTAGSAKGGEMQYALGADSSTAPEDGWDGSVLTGVNAGTYHVWYRVDGDANHENAPAKCVDAKIGMAAQEVVAPVGKKDLVYNGKEQVLASAARVSYGPVQYALGTDDAKPPEDGWGPSVPTGTDAGTYHVWYKVEGTDNYSGVGPASVLPTSVIAKASPTVTAPTAKELAYNGSPQALVSAGSTTGGKMQYALGADPYTPPENGWGASVPTGTDVGTYHVWYKVVGDANHAGTAPACVEATISKAAPTVTAPTAKELTYTGNPQALVSTGSAKGGEMRYALGSDAGTAPAEGWSPDVPEGIDAGTYHVWYKVVGDANHSSMDPAYVEAKIAPADIAEAKVTLKKASVTYNGKAKKPAVKSVVLGGKKLEAGRDYTVSYKNNRKLGTATAIVTGKGNYKAFAKATFIITLAKPKLATFGHPSKSAVDISWGAVAGAKRYQLQWRAAGGSWKTAKASGTSATTRRLVNSATISGLAKGKSYEFRVRAASGSAKGAWSNVSHRWLKKVPSGKAKAAGSGSVKVRWKALGRANGGYVACVRYSKGGEVVAKVSVGAGRTSVRISGLKKGRRVWVSVRPVRVADGEKYFGVLRTVAAGIKVK